MKTFIVITRGQNGVRNGRGTVEKFVVAASSDADAADKARAAAYEGAVVVEVREVSSIQRVSVGN